MTFFLGNPLALKADVSTQPRTNGNGVAMQRPRPDFKIKSASMPVSMESTLMRFIQVVVIRCNIGPQGATQDFLGEGMNGFPWLTGNRAKARIDQSGLGSFEVFEQLNISDDRHLDDLSYAMAQPAFPQRFKKESVGDRNDGWVVGTQQVLVAKAIATGAG